MGVIAKAIDCFAPLTAANAMSLKVSGISAVGRYLNNLSPAEVKSITDAGLFIYTFYETYQTYARYFTFSQGQQDATAAVKLAQALGQPAGSTITFPVDYDAQPADLPVIASYFRGLRSRIGAYKLGGYGGYAVVESLAAQEFCDVLIQTVAWSQGKLSGHADVYQKQCDTTLAGIQVDIDDVYQNPGWWPTPKESRQMSYPSIPVQMNGRPYKAIVVDGSTYVIWTAFKDEGLNLTKADFGDVEIDEKKPPQATQDGNTYIVWTALGPVNPILLPGGGWNFVTKAKRPVNNPAPTPAPVTTPTVNDRQIVAVVKGDRQGNKFYFVPQVKQPDGMFSGMGHFLFDTGAECMLIDQSMATAFKLPQGKAETIGGVTGSAQAYDSSITLKFGDEEFNAQFAIVDPTYAGFDDGLFGLKFFVDNGLSIDLDLQDATLTIYRKVAK